MARGIDYVSQAVDALGMTGVTLDADASVTHAREVGSAYADSGVAVVVVPEVAASTLGPDGLAGQIRVASQQRYGDRYDTVVVLVDKARDSFGVAGPQAPAVATALNTALHDTGDAGQALLDAAPAVLAAAGEAATTTRTAPAPAGESGISPLVGGGVLLGVAVAGAVLVAALRRRPVRVVPGEAWEGRTPLPSATDPGAGSTAVAGADAAAPGMGAGFAVAYDPAQRYSAADVRATFEGWVGAYAQVAPGDCLGLEAVVADARDLLSRWEEVDRAGGRPEVLAMLLDYLPATLATYYDIPADLRERPIGTSARTPTQTVREQVELIGQALGEIRTAVYEDRIQGLQVRSVFLKSKYERNDSTLQLP